MGENDIADFTLDESTFGKNEQNDRGLAVQNIGTLDLDKITVETFEVMSRQATVNIGTIGHVAHGKSTVVKALSGVKTQKYHREAVMNITIHLGYANAKVFKCDKCELPAAYHAFPSSQPDKTDCPTCGSPLTLKRHFSFVDCPGHDVLMATMLNGAAIMDAALLLIAANEPFPQPQTLEHLAAIEVLCVPSLLILQNKIDLVAKEHAEVQQSVVRYYLRSRTNYGGAPIIPISAQLALNTDYLLEYLCHMPLPTRCLRARPRLHVLRSFDVTPPGNTLESLEGGVVGGTLQQGVLRVGDVVELFPGLLALTRRDGVLPSRTGMLSGQELSFIGSPPPGEVHMVPLRTTVRSLMSEANRLQYAVPGGLIAVGTYLDPSLTRQNKLRGQVLRLATTHDGDGSSADNNDDGMQVYQEVELQFFLLPALLGVSRDRSGSAVTTTTNTAANARNAGVMVPSRYYRVEKLKDGENVVLSINTLTTAATVLRTAHGKAKVRLECPVYCACGDRVALARFFHRKIRLIGWGVVKRGVPVRAVD
ncbi:putative translation initiation factor EIF-2B gamma subunit [Trypanosoma grayi]|uniref:putative translation initiation factor EIF-2B gamma subunit n=1 Tax=Trypanosoma grayi TaxID=71804 RepID=UPI0004F4A1FB|nr:putative translation initiation factor EIF-2B gamma subunit [Trypanosoma grayi]KEG09024.1 putative translation initiation factor EIF-2B gamma subunit [Trypanosoma grayi]